MARTVIARFLDLPIVMNDMGEMPDYGTRPATPEELAAVKERLLKWTGKGKPGSLAEGILLSVHPGA